MSSTRNLFILGLAIALGYLIPIYVQQKGTFHTGEWQYDSDIQ